MKQKTNRWAGVRRAALTLGLLTGLTLPAATAGCSIFDDESTCTDKNVGGIAYAQIFNEEFTKELGITNTFLTLAVPDIGTVVITATAVTTQSIGNGQFKQVPTTVPIIKSKIIEGHGTVSRFQTCDRLIIRGASSMCSEDGISIPGVGSSTSFAAKCGFLAPRGSIDCIQGKLTEDRANHMLNLNQPGEFFAADTFTCQKWPEPRLVRETPAYQPPESSSPSTSPGMPGSSGTPGGDHYIIAPGAGGMGGEDGANDGVGGSSDSGEHTRLAPQAPVIFDSQTRKEGSSVSMAI